MREEENNKSSQDSKVKSIFKKRWVFPAIYIASAAIILIAVLWFQNSSTDNAIDSDKYGMNSVDKQKNFDDLAVEVNRSMENVTMPLTAKDREAAVIQKKFYDDKSSEKEQEAALVVYENQYHPNTGVDITVKDSEGFDVVAALSGTVTKVDEDALLGNVIEIEHENGIVTQYQSVKDFQVKVGEDVEQGQAIATAGKSMINEEAGVHVHFEIRKDGMPVNPEDFFDKPMSALEETTDETSVNEEKATGNHEMIEEEAEGEKEPAADKPADDRNGKTEDGTSEKKEETPSKSEDKPTSSDKQENPANDKSGTADDKQAAEKEAPTDKTDEKDQKDTPSEKDAKEEQTQNKDA
jgi:stage II sporulation protein Q